MPLLAKKPGKPRLPASKTIFDDDTDESDGDNGDLQQEDKRLGVTYGSTGRNSHANVTKHGGSSRTHPLSTDPSHFTNLASTHASRKHAQSAQQEDASIYDYDTVYDSLHARPKAKQQSAGPKYMQGLLDSAEIRKRDQLQAKDKMLAKERQAEGELYADKEKFVTGAYKVQQEEVRKLAAEEKQREEEALKRRREAGGGMTGWYKGILEREDDRRAAIAEALQKGTEDPEQQVTENNERKLADTAKKSRRHCER